MTGEMMRLTFLLAVFICASTLAAQTQPAAWRQQSIAEGRPVEGALNKSGSEFIRDLHPGMRIALGALVPGLPQYLEGQWRGWAYFAAEGAAIAGMVFFNAQAHDRLDRYHEISRQARRNFVLGGLRNNPEEVTEEMSGGFGEYYEDLTKWPSSGDYDNDPSLDGIQPETDTRTYNGHQWQIAKINNYSGTNGGIPVAQSAEEESHALAAYREAVYPLQYNWDWTGLESSEALYHSVFNSAEDSYRRRNKFTAVLLANHIISAIDMLVMEKINQTRGMRNSGLSLELFPRAYDSKDGPGLALSLSRSF
jgi:hypothetical protein